MQLQSPDSEQKYQNHPLEKRQPFQPMVLGTMDIHMQQTETRFISLTLYKKINSKCTKALQRPETLK
jgi:hypothetical protein